MANSIIQLIQKEIIVEWRQRYAINGFILQVFSAVFVVYLSVKVLNNPTWNAIFWVIMLFVSINAIAKSFIGETKGKNLYYHSIAKPQQLLTAKLLYNILLNCILSSLCLGIYSLLLGNYVAFKWLYYLAVILGSSGFAITFTMLSAISSKSGNGSLLMPVLSIPVIIPLLLILIKTCKRAMDGIDSGLVYNDLLVLAFFNMLIFILAWFLFPSLWKD
jgi:heme exporter protein B